MPWHPATRLSLFPHALRCAMLDAIAVLAPTSCSGCGAPDRALCASCSAALEPAVRTADLDTLPVAYAHDYDGVVRSVVASFKDGGRTDAAGRLAPSLAAAVGAALGASTRVPALGDGGPHRPDPGLSTPERSASTRSAPAPAAFERSASARSAPSPPVHLVTIPSSRAALRARGYAPVELLLRRCGLRSERLLRPRRAAADQAGLSAESRRSNREGWLGARAALDGACIVLVDDILTTGSTLLEARRALQDAGATVLAAAVVARTPRRDGTDSATATSTRGQVGEHSADCW